MRLEHINESFFVSLQVRDLVEKCTCPSQFPMVRVSEGKYRIGDTKVLIFVRVSICSNLNIYHSQCGPRSLLILYLRQTIHQLIYCDCPYNCEKIRKYENPPQVPGQ